MVKPLSFKGDKKPKKRKRSENPTDSSTADRDAQVQKLDQEPDADDDDTWVSADAPSDLSGPVMLVLPTTKPSALACDAGGKVFTIPIENIVDGNKESAEPHDVRMVWVVNKIVGTEEWRFKGSTGKYLSCDKIGVLSATSEAVSPLECWKVEQRTEGGGGFRLKTQRGTCLSVKAAKNSKGEERWEVRGDANDEADGETEVSIRMQARFKPRLKKNKEEKKLSKISRRELEDAVGRRLDEDEVRTLKRARREGDYHERLLELKVKGKHDKFG